MTVSRRARIEAMLAESPGDLFLRYALALELEKEGDHAGSLAGLGQLMREERPYVPAFFRTGQQLVGLGRVDEARGALREGIEEARRQNDLHAASEMGELLSSLGALGESR